MNDFSLARGHVVHYASLPYIRYFTHLHFHLAILHLLALYVLHTEHIITVYLHIFCQIYPFIHFQIAATMESPNTTATLVRPPPPGVTPNFNHFSSAVNAVFIAAGICGFVVVLLAVMRLYTKICLRPKWAVSDYFALLGMAWAVGYIPLIASVFNQGQFGHHSWDVLVAKLSNKQYLLVLLAEVLYGPVLFIIKMSLLLVYREVWRYSPSWMRQCSMAGIIVFGLFYLAMTAAEIALCAPRSGEDYILALSSPRCQRTKALAICSGVFNIISDTYLLALPIKPTWDIHGPISKRLSITVVFMSGIMWVSKPLQRMFTDMYIAVLG